jgi:hypothetical protein
MNPDSISVERFKELSMLDDLAESYFRSACAGDHKSADLMIEISHRRAKLLGLDAPTNSRMEVISYDAEELQRQYAILSRMPASSSQASVD